MVTVSLVRDSANNQAARPGKEGSVNVVRFIKQRIGDDADFFREATVLNDASTDDHSRLEYLAGLFFSDEEEKRRDLYARLLVSYTMSQHAKSGASAFGDILHAVEASKEYDFKGQRLHRFHLVNVYLLGLALYSALPKLQELLHVEIGRKERELLSGSSPRNEFAFRWKLAALFHDVGASLALYGPDDRSELQRSLTLFQMAVGENWRLSDWQNVQIEDIIQLTRQKSIFDVLAGIDRAQSQLLEQLFDKLRRDGFKLKRKESEIRFDHGVISAALVLKSLDEMYRHYDNLDGEKKVIHFLGRRISFRREFFDSSIATAAHAIALHSIDLYEKDWEGTRVLEELGLHDLKVYDFEEHPLAALLKLCDTLQEWDKPKARGRKKLTKPEAIDLRFDGDELQLIKFPKKRKLQAQLDRFFRNAEFISLQ